jgi:hypothetical protein
MLVVNARAPRMPILFAFVLLIVLAMSRDEIKQL